MIAKLKNIIQSGDSALLFMTILLVNVGNYLINLLLGRLLGPVGFAEAGVLATGVLILSFVAVGFQMTAAKYTANYVAAGKKDQLEAFQQWFYRKASFWGLVMGASVALSAWYLQSFLHFNSILPFLLIAAGIPVYLQMSAGRGFLQGNLQFKKLALSYLFEMIGRLLITALFLGIALSFGGQQTTEAVALGFLASFVAAHWVSKIKFEKKRIFFTTDEQKKIVGFMLIMGSYELSQIMISHSDVILVKHYFSNEEAGLYTALALIGRMVFFATWSVVTLLFPKVVQREKQGLPHQHLFYRSLLLVLSVGLGITLGAYFLADWVMLILFGGAFISVSHLLWMYACATTLFACANVFAYYYLSLNRYLPVVLSAVAGVLQIVLITLFHTSIEAVIYAQIGAMGILLIGMLIFHTIKNYKNEKTTYSPRLSLSTQ